MVQLQASGKQTQQTAQPMTRTWSPSGAQRMHC